MAIELVDFVNKETGESIVASKMYNSDGLVVKPEYLPLCLKCITHMDAVKNQHCHH